MLLTGRKTGASLALPFHSTRAQAMQENAPFNYEAQCAVTLSDKFHGDKVSLVRFRGLLLNTIAHLTMLDKVKKGLFYGRDVPVELSPLGARLDLSNFPKTFAMALPTENGQVDEAHALFFNEENAAAVIHAIIGNATEAAEQLEILLTVLDGGTFDALHYVEEVGDSQWYNAIGVRAVGTTLAVAQRINIEKLRNRFGDKFSEYDANNRDLFAERQTMESSAVANTNDA